ncbi:MAG TPA: Flp family type IVb pilin [Trichococcus sp.]|nr:Flp family type IVb pilin [Trichococcus sp.]
MEIMKRLVQEEEGQGLVEYALIIAIISIVIVAAGPAVATAIKTKFAEIATGLQ